MNKKEKLEYIELDKGEFRNDELSQYMKSALEHYEQFGHFLNMMTHLVGEKSGLKLRITVKEQEKIIKEQEKTISELKEKLQEQYEANSILIKKLGEK